MCVCDLSVRFYCGCPYHSSYILHLMSSLLYPWRAAPCCDIFRLGQELRQPSYFRCSTCLKALRGKSSMGVVYFTHALLQATFINKSASKRCPRNAIGYMLNACDRNASVSGLPVTNVQGIDVDRDVKALAARRGKRSPEAIVIINFMYMYTYVDACRR